MKAADIMSTKVVTINHLATIDRAAEVMKQNHLRGLIVDRASEDDAYGIITTTDIAVAIANGRDPAKTYVCEVMTKPCIVVNPDLSVEYIAKLFARSKIRIAPVIKDKLIGVVSLTDIITKTDCLTSDIKYISTVALPELPSDSWKESEWEVTDWEEEFDNWCSG
jgi:CBS domain-containing protein